MRRVDMLWLWKGEVSNSCRHLYQPFELDQDMNATTAAVFVVWRAGPDSRVLRDYRGEKKMTYLQNNF